MRVTIEDTFVTILVTGDGVTVEVGTTVIVTVVDELVDDDFNELLVDDLDELVEDDFDELREDEVECKVVVEAWDVVCEDVIDEVTFEDEE